mmetsp:Transcript_765/g.2048  ORF Transcript_765/g.2048 Transcript_765/m.2048 type:complete len:201 (-) Transcript_765:875-1477(-)
MRSAAAVLVTAVLALAALAARVEAIEYKCSANLVIGEALWSRLEGEGSPKELDLTHRLNSKGERYGRKIAYKDSELRYLELLEDFCAKGSLPKALPLPVEGSDDADSTRWVPLTSPARRELGEKLFPRKEAKSEMETLLGNHCLGVVDDFEDEVTDLLRQDWDEPATFLTEFIRVVSPTCEQELNDMMRREANTHLQDEL